MTNPYPFDDLMYRAGMTAQGCWEDLDTYDQEAILRFAWLVVRHCADQCIHVEDREEILSHFGVGK